MPGAPLPTYRTMQLPGVEKADKTDWSTRALLVQGLRAAGSVVFVAAAGFIIYHFLASSANSGGVIAGSLAAANSLSLLAQDSSGVAIIGETPKGDQRKYKHVVLPNGLQVVSVQDERASQKAFAMAVEAGSFDDPKNLPGLAHFCEHMLFLGTGKYPEASGFDNFMNGNGGSNNAYTADEVTVYYAEVAQAAGKEGLDRFADFFRAPLFDKQYVGKEVHAIDSEHAKNVQDPMRRVMAVAMSLANPESPLGTFHTGDAHTLMKEPMSKGVDPVDELKIYFKSHYCPAKMHLVTYGSEPLDVQLAQAKQDFGSLATDNSCKAPRRSFARPAPWGPQNMGKFVNVVGTNPQAEMWLHFAGLPDCRKEFKSQPLMYIEHVLGYSGENSLGQVLQDNLGLVSSLKLMADQSSAGTGVYVLFSLTKPGEHNLNLILDVFYAYLAEVRRKGVDTRLYDSLARVSKLQWDWAEPTGPSDTASDLAEKMTRLPVEHLLSGDSLIEKQNISLVSSLFEALKPANMNLIYVSAAPDKRQGNSSSFSVVDLSDKEQFKTLPHYGVKYATKTLSQQLPGAAELWDKWLSGTVAPDLASRIPSSLSKSGVVLPVIPGPLEGVPTSIPLTHMHAAEGASAAEIFGARPAKVTSGLLEASKFLQASPKLLGQNGEVWYRSGWATNSPKVQIQAMLRPSMAPGQEILVQEVLRLGVFAELLQETMGPKMADLTSAGVGYGIDVDPKGLSFTFSGFAPMMQELSTKVLAEFNSFNNNVSAIPLARFKRTTQQLRSSLLMYSDMPITYAINDRNMLLVPGSFSRAESLLALDEVTPLSASSSVDDVLFSKPMQLTSLAMGNIGSQEANSAVSSIVAGIHTARSLDKNSKKAGEPEHVSRVVKIVRPVEVRSKNPRAGDPNDAVVLSIIAGVSTVSSRVVYGLLGHILASVAYTELRTKRQLGYVVSAGAAQLSNVQYLSCVVQGNALKADAVEGSIEHVFTHLMPKHLKDMTSKEFASTKDALLQDLLKPPLNFQEEVEHFWGPIKQGGRCFDLRDNMAKYLNTSLNSKDDLIKAWDSLANPSKGLRSKIVVKYFAGSVPARPTAKEAAAIWAKQGVAGSALSLLSREYQETTVLDHVDSKVRDQFVQDGGYFPRELKCDLSQPASVSSPS